MEVRHLAIIMDGNGRWAKSRGKKRYFGHNEGAKKIREITEFCMQIGIKFLTLYAFSTENWRRPKEEVDFLMNLLEKFLKRERKTYLQSQIAFKTIGDISILPIKIQQQIATLEEQTKHFGGLMQILALNYGSKDELRRAFLKLKEHPNITEEDIEQCLDTAGIPEVDMLIRTGGEQRLSNFLLWQSAYAELFFTKTLWPDFSCNELKAMLEEFSLRQRRFGGV